jgi:hypothetical protein
MQNTSQNTSQPSNKPEAVFKVGAVRASIFRNTIVQNGRTIPLPKVVLEVRYKDKAGEWKGTNSLSLNEVPKAILALEKAYEYLTSHRDAPAPDADMAEPSSAPPSHGQGNAFQRGPGAPSSHGFR